MPEQGDWYARHMYEPGHAQYAHHLATYGHPSLHGWKDVIPLWKAESWEPGRLIDLYRKAGARYFVSMGVHHDNFDLWDSKFQRWNAVRMGPKRDVVGEWAAAARAHGLRFGVSEHLGASFTWFQSSHRADREGPQAGVPYDGADPTHAGLYHFPAEDGDKEWYSMDPRWHAQWAERIRDLIDRYELDLLYSDGGVPFGNATGYGMIAHLYNVDLQRRGRVEAVYTCKQPSGGRWVEDVERGVLTGIQPHPWQTDTSIGDWYYNRNWTYRPAAWAIHLLADVVSKNGNLLLNVVQRPDGALDPEPERLLDELAAWNAVNGEAVFGTRPWLVHGEGPVRPEGGAFKEDFAYTAADIRFTARGADLYAIALGLPADGRVVIRSLAAGPGRIDRVELLGRPGPLAFARTAAGLTVSVPGEPPAPHALALKITGADLRPAPRTIGSRELPGR